MSVAVQIYELDPVKSLFTDLLEYTRQQTFITSGGLVLDLTSSPGTNYWDIYRHPTQRISLDDVDYCITGSAVTSSPLLSEPTSATNPDKDMALLAVAAEKGDELGFIEASNSIDWIRRSPEDYIHAVRLALSAGAHLKARKLSAQGAVQYPDYAELQKFARILAPPKILPNTEPPDPSLRLNRDWLIAHREEYLGRWVALKAGQLLAVGDSPKELKTKIGDTKRVLLTKVY